MGSSASDIPKVNLYYHPICRASSRLMKDINNNQESSKLFNFINISTFSSAPHGVKRIPCIQYENKMIHGKECFDIVSRLVSGPTSCNIYSTGSKVCSFDDNNSTEYQICPNFSNIDGNPTVSDGFNGVPTYNGEVKTLQGR